MTKRLEGWLWVCRNERGRWVFQIVIPRTAKVAPHHKPGYPSREAAEVAARRLAERMGIELEESRD